MKALLENLDEGREDFPEEVINRVIEILNLDTSIRHELPDGSSISTHQKLTDELNRIKWRFSNPNAFSSRVPPSKMRDALKKQHKAILNALEVFRSLEYPNFQGEGDRKVPNQVRQWLWRVADVDPRLSPGLTGHDVMTLDSNFYTARICLQKVEGHFSSILEYAESQVKRRGENKPDDFYSDHLLFSLCDLFWQMTGEIPEAFLGKDKEEGIVKGKIIEFLDYILRLIPYPNDINHWALEIRLRRLKIKERYINHRSDTKK